MNVRPVVSRPRLILYKTFALSSLVLAATLFPALPVHAGHWRFSAAGSTASATVIKGIVKPGTPAPSPWQPPPDADDGLSVTLPSVTVQDTNDTPGQTPSCSCKAVASIQITATWVPDSPSEPTPPTVWVVETSSATWSNMPGRATEGITGGGGTDDGPPPPPPPAFTFSGAADDGLGDPYVELPPGGPPASGSSITSNPQHLKPSPTGWHLVSTTSGHFTLDPVSLSANGTAAGRTPGMCSVQCGLGPYTVKTHPQPYNYTQVVGSNNSNRYSVK